MQGGRVMEGELRELPRPPEGAYGSPKEAQAAMNQFARPHGYALVVKRSIDDKKGECRRVIFACDRHGERRPPRKPRASSAPTRSRSSRRCGCPMEINVVRDMATGRWRVEHRGMEATHNHAPSESPAAHPILRRADRTPGVLAAIAADAAAGAPPAQTLTRISESHPSVSLVPRDVYNERQRVRRMLASSDAFGEQTAALGVAVGAESAGPGDGSAPVDGDSGSAGEEHAVALPCPPIATYRSPKEAQADMNLFARGHGYALVVKRSYYDKKGAIRRVVFACDRHGERRPTAAPRDATRTRPSASSRRCGCPMEINILRNISTGIWEVQHRGTETKHNHLPSSSPSDHPIHRRADRTADVRVAIAAATESGATATEILARINEKHPTAALSARDIYNERQRVRRLAAAQRLALG